VESYTNFCNLNWKTEIQKIKKRPHSTRPPFGPRLRPADLAEGHDVACSRAGPHARGTRGGAAIGGERNNEVECCAVGEHGVDRRSQPGNFTESGTHPRSAVAAGWREVVSCHAPKF
jgi:hypothetical protein